MLVVGDREMRTYFCLIEVRPGAVPELRALDCDRDDALGPSLRAALRDWPCPHHVEVVEGGRTVFSGFGPALNSWRTE